MVYMHIAHKKILTNAQLLYQRGYVNSTINENKFITIQHRLEIDKLEFFKIVHITIS